MIFCCGNLSFLASCVLSHTSEVVCFSFKSQFTCTIKLILLLIFSTSGISKILTKEFTFVTKNCGYDINIPFDYFFLFSSCV